MTRDKGAIDPDDLDFTDDERVVQIDEDRYVISGDGPPRLQDPTTDATISPESSGSPPADTPKDALTQAEVSKWLAASFQDTGFTYGFDATMAVDNEVTRHRLVSNDLPITFETLLTWFVRNATTDSTTEEALGILLVASGMSVQYPPHTLKQLVEEVGLEPTDTIATLLEAVDEDGIKLPSRS